MHGSRSSIWSRVFAQVALPVLALAVAGCGDTRHFQAALHVTVSIGPEVKAGCVQVWARAEGGEEKAGQVLSIDGRSELSVAVFRSPELNGQVQVGARGFLADDCAEAQGRVLNEESETARAAFEDGKTVEVALALDGVPVAFDADGDHYRGAAFGGVDCDDTAATVYPGAPELCDDGRDNDCNGAADCDEPTCDLKGCDDGDPCTVGDVCGGGSCLPGAAATCTTPPDECHQATGTCVKESGGCVYDVTAGAPCSQGFCTADGLCVDSATEADCGNGLDDDHNGLVDCADPDCDARACNSGNVCMVGATCQSQVCAGAVSKVCTQSGNPCLQTDGTCNAKGDCDYAPLAVGTPCGSGKECHAGGKCGGSETGAKCANGTDDDGDGLADCEDPSCLGASCDDGDACTQGDACSAAGQCEPATTTSCTTPGVCQTATGASCDSSNGKCVYPATPDVACTGGFCSATGSCDPPFPYTPKNFDPLDYDPSVRSGPYTFNCGTSVIDTTPGTATPFQNFCSQTTPNVFTVTLSNGVTAVVLPMKGLTVSGFNTLQVKGTRPVIFAVYGDAAIDGTLYAGADHQTPGAGGNSSACGSGTGGAGGTTSNTGGGGGGGGFASVGGAGGTSSSGAGGGAAGVVNGAAALSPLRGGCGGGTGGNSGGAGGAGGGAVQVSASGALSVYGWISAPGGGGLGGAGSDRGGGGGGSGGAILLEGDTVAFGLGTAITATGGGGGEGGGTSSTGASGANGPEGFVFSAASGGSGNSNKGGNGGDGAEGSTAAGAGGAGSGGGAGGGGGGLGYIRVNALNGCTGTMGATLNGHVSHSGANCP